MKTLHIKVLPRSSKNEIIGEQPDGTIKIKLTVPPVDGQANKKLIELLSKEYNVSRSKIKIVKGLTSRNKVVNIEDATHPSPLSC